MSHSIFKKLLFLCLSIWSFDLFPKIEISDPHRFFSEQEKSDIEERIERIKNDYDIGVFVFPYAVIERSASLEETINSIFNQIKKVVSTPADIKEYNFVYYGRGSKDNWSLFLTGLPLVINGQKNDPEKTQKIADIYGKLRFEFEHGKPSVSESLPQNIYLIEKLFSPVDSQSESLQLPLPPILDVSSPSPSDFFPIEFGFELNGWPFSLLFISAFLVWKFTHRISLIAILGIIQGGIVSFVMSGHLEISVIKDHFFTALLFGLLFFIVQSVKVNLRLKKEKRENTPL